MEGTDQQSGKAGKQPRARAADDGVDSERAGEGGGGKRSRVEGEAFDPKVFHRLMQESGGDKDKEKPSRAAGEDLLARLGFGGAAGGTAGSRGHSLVAGPAQEHRQQTCGLPNCLCPAGHKDDPYITTPGPGGVGRIPKRCESQGCSQTLYRCEVQQWVWNLAKRGQRPHVGLMQCNRCRGGWGQCLPASMATLTAEIADYMTGVRAMQNLLADESSVEHFGDDEAQSFLDALMRALDACVAGAPEGTMLLIAVQKASGDWLQEIYNIWDRDGIRALLQSIGATAPAEDGSDLLFTACSPFIRDARTNWIESEGQFRVLARILEGEEGLRRPLWREKNAIPAFCRATAVDYEEGDGRKGDAMGQGGSAISSRAGVSVWRVNPIPAGQLQSIVAVTPKSQLPRVTGDSLADGDYKQIKYGASQRMLETARGDRFRGVEPWPAAARKTLSSECEGALQNQPRVHTFSFPKSKPRRGERFTDSETIVSALISLRDDWVTKETVVTKVYDKLKVHVYDRWAAGQRSWADLRQRTGRTKRLLQLFGEFVAACRRSQWWNDAEVRRRVAEIGVGEGEEREDSVGEEDEALLNTAVEHFAGAASGLTLSDQKSD